MPRAKTQPKPPPAVERVWRGGHALEALLVPIDSVHRDPANARKHGDRNLSTIRASLARFGQQRPILVDSNGIIRAGNGTHEAAEATGWTHIAAVRSDLQGVEATAYAITDNRSAELAEWDDAVLAQTLDALRSEPDFDLGAVGYRDDELNTLLSQLATEAAGPLNGIPVDDPQGEWQGMPEFEHEDLTALQSIHVHFKTREDVAAFTELVKQTITEKTKFIWYPEQERESYGTVE